MLPPRVRYLRTLRRSLLPFAAALTHLATHRTSAHFGVLRQRALFTKRGTLSLRTHYTRRPASRDSPLACRHFTQPHAARCLTTSRGDSVSAVTSLRAPYATAYRRASSLIAPHHREGAPLPQNSPSHIPHRTSYAWRSVRYVLAVGSWR